MNNKFRTALVLLLLTCSPAFAAGDPKRGAQLFASNCEMCHPGAGNSMTPDKPLKGAAFAAKYPTDSAVVSVIRHGIKNTVMSPFPPDRLNDAQVDDIVAYLRSLTPAPKATPAKTAGTGAAPAGKNGSKTDAKTGAAITKKDCSKTHAKTGGAGAAAAKSR